MSELQHFEGEIHALDERIGRLAILCGVDLSRTETVVGLIKGHFETCTRGDSTITPHRAELRALLMMKYKMEISCIDAIGAGECARLISEEDERLRRSGFPRQSLPK